VPRETAYAELRWRLSRRSRSRSRRATPEAWRQRREQRLVPGLLDRQPAPGMRWRLGRARPALPAQQPVRPALRVGDRDRANAEAAPRWTWLAGVSLEYRN
jgi:hypothetical protein